MKVSSCFSVIHFTFLWITLLLQTRGVYNDLFPKKLDNVKQLERRCLKLLKAKVLHGMDRNAIPMILQEIAEFNMSTQGLYRSPLNATEHTRFVDATLYKYVVTPSNTFKTVREIHEHMSVLQINQPCPQYQKVLRNVEKFKKTAPQDLYERPLKKEDLKYIDPRLRPYVDARSVMYETVADLERAFITQTTPEAQSILASINKFNQTMQNLYRQRLHFTFHKAFLSDVLRFLLKSYWPERFNNLMDFSIYHDDLLKTVLDKNERQAREKIQLKVLKRIQRDRKNCTRPLLLEDKVWVPKEIWNFLSFESPKTGKTT